MKFKLLGALLFLAVIAQGDRAYAFDPFSVAPSNSLALLQPIEEETAEVVPEDTPPVTPPPVIHTVVNGDNLTKIAKHYKTSVERLYAKNSNISHPDDIKVGQKITIPTATEALQQREIPRPVIETARRVTNASSGSVQARGYIAGNSYYAGQCTWYAKSKRMDLPNNLGNANTWYARAAAQGYSVGYSPRAGAIGEALTGYMHVVYVERVQGNRVFISEMNYKGAYVVSTRWASASEFRYIY